MPDRFYITTPIYYVNAEPHLGHAYTTLVADTMARWHRFRGDDTWFLTGTDEHGDKIQKAAAAAGVTPLAFAGGVSAAFEAAWRGMGISHDDFIRTTQERHQAVVKAILAKIHAQGDIRQGAYEGLYCVGCERYYAEPELVDGKCPDHQVEPEKRREENYFFNMEKYRLPLRQHIASHPEFIRPERYANEVLRMLDEPIGELCITRPKTRLTWGIEVPFDPEYVVYVWFDALINYVSALGGPGAEKFEKYWPVCHHLIAKDILKPHAIYWPTMLLAAGIPLYAGLRVHGFWNIAGAKMSKSVGNVRGAFEMKEKYGNEAFRYFVLREMSFGQDANFDEDPLVERINADLANGIGNLLARTTSMARKYFPDGVPAAAPGPGAALLAAARALPAALAPRLSEFQISDALQEIWKVIGQADGLVNDAKPWVIAKDPARQDELAAVIRALLETVALVAANLAPFLPQTAAAMARALALDPAQLLTRAALGRENIPANHRVAGGGHLFERIAAKPDEKRK